MLYMKYFTILNELLSSDTVSFFLIGLAIALVIGMKIRSKKGRLAGMAACFAVYAVCELLLFGMLLLWLPASYMQELALLLIGTEALGGIAGFAVSLLLRMRKK